MNGTPLRMADGLYPNALREGGRGEPRQRERRTISALLIATATFPGQTFAQTCASIRPGWVPGTEVSQFNEAVALFSSIPSLVLAIASVIAIRFRSQWGALGCVVFWSGWISVITLLDPSGRTSAMRIEGCMGSPTLFIAAVTAICVAMILYTLPRETRL